MAEAITWLTRLETSRDLVGLPSVFLPDSECPGLFEGLLELESPVASEDFEVIVDDEWEKETTEPEFDDSEVVFDTEDPRAVSDSIFRADCDVVFDADDSLLVSDKVF